jgi:hypothetical protein
VIKIEQFLVLTNGSMRDVLLPGIGEGESAEFSMTAKYNWQESYMRALLETDWTSMQERIRAVESEIRDRRRVFAENQGGTAEERQAIADAINSLMVLRRDVAEWQNRQAHQPGTKTLLTKTLL